MLNMAHHGGRCCGIKHLKDFDSAIRIDDKVGHIRDVMTAWWSREDQTNGGDPNDGRVVEATLTDEQLAITPEWAPALRTVGFVPVSRFLNSNSDNMVTVFHYHIRGDVTLFLDDVPHWDLPYTPPALPLPAVVSFYYVNVYRSGPGIGRFGSLENCNAPRSAVRRIGVNRVDTYDNGDSVTTRLDNA